MASYKFVNRFSVFAHLLSIKHLVKTRLAQVWTSVVTPGLSSSSSSRESNTMLSALKMQAPESFTFQASIW